MKHKSEDYKINAVKHYLNKKISMDKVCSIFSNQSFIYTFC
jgi:hypothetical protein